MTVTFLTNMAHTALVDTEPDDVHPPAHPTQQDVLLRTDDPMAVIDNMCRALSATRASNKQASSDSGRFVSAIRYFNQPILPPVVSAAPCIAVLYHRHQVTASDRAVFAQIRAKAVEIEKEKAELNVEVRQQPFIGC